MAIIHNLSQTNLYFVRHAHSTFTPDEMGRPLSTHGSRDVENIRNMLKQKSIDHIISSPYQRSTETIKGVANYYKKDIEIIDGFKERKLSEEPVDDFPQAMKKLWSNWEDYFPGGESNTTAQKRGVRATLNILEKYKGENIVIGTHGNIMVLIMNYFDSQYDFYFWKKLKMPDMYRLTFSGTNFVKANHICRNEDNFK